MKIEDIIVLGKMGYTATQVAQMVALGTQQQAAPAPVQVVQPPQPVAASAAPAAPQMAAQPDGMQQLLAGMTALQTRLNSIQTPVAGAVGGTTPVTSIEDIIRAPLVAPESPAPYDFKKGVNQ